MRKILLYFFFLLSLPAYAQQFSYEATGDYGKLWDVTQDQSVPNRLYALSLSNHVMVSNDWGKTWDIFYAFENSVTRISNLKLLRDGKSIAFTAETPIMDRNGLYILELASKTITHHYITPDQELGAWVSSYDIYDPEGKTAVLNTQYPEGFSVNTEVYFTKDGGQSWYTIYYSILNDYVHINSSVFHPDDPKKIYLARSLGSRGVNGGLFISSDEGNTWREALAGKGALSAFAFHPKNHNEFFIGSGINFGESPEALFHTLDSGKTFEQIPITFNDGLLDNINKIIYDPGNDKNMWMLEDDAIMKSTDGGAHWTSTLFEPGSDAYFYGNSMVINPRNSNELLIFSDAWPQHSKDGGKTFTQVKLPFCVASSAGIGSNNTSRQLYYSILGGYISKDLSTNKSNSYNIHPYDLVNVREMRVIPDTSVPGRVFFFRQGDSFFTGSELFYSDDLGATLKQLPADEYASNLEFLQRDPNHKDRYWVSYSYDGAFSTLYRLDLSDPGNPEFISVPLTTDGMITAAFIPHGNDGQSIYLSGGSKVYYSGDGGVTWGEMKEGLDLLEGFDMIWDIKANPFNEQEMAAVSTYGIFQTTDGGKHWSLTYPASDLKEITYSNAVDGHLFAASYSTLYTDTRLVFSTNNGAKWNNVSADMLSYLVCHSKLSFQFYKDHADIYFATPDLGVVKYQLTNLLSPQLLFLHSFTGSLQRGHALLEWHTRNEEELSHYELERSMNNKDFTRINTQQATNSAGSFYYNYEDQEFPALAAQHGHVYYRLKLVSDDDSFSYSDTVKLSARDMYIYPVPAHDVINLHVQGVTEPGKYRVLFVDMLGRQYAMQQFDIPTGQTTLNMSISRLASGMYIMLVETRPGDIRKFKFIKL